MTLCAQSRRLGAVLVVAAFGALAVLSVLGACSTSVSTTTPPRSLTAIPFRTIGSARPTRTATPTPRPTPTVPSGYERQHNDALQITCILPTGWSPQPEPTQEGSDLLAINVLPASKDDCFLGVRLSGGSLPAGAKGKGLSAADLVDMATQMAAEQGNTAIGAPKETTVAGWPAGYVAYTRKIEGAEITAHYQSVWVSTRTRLYCLWLADVGGCDDRVKRYWDLFLQSIEFTEPPS